MCIQYLFFMAISLEHSKILYIFAQLMDKIILGNHILTSVTNIMWS